MGLNGLDILIDGLWSTIYIYCGDTFANCMLTLWSFFFTVMRTNASLLNSFLLNAPAWAPKIRKTPRVSIISLTVG